MVLLEYNLLGALFTLGTYIWDGIASVYVERSCLNFIGDPLLLPQRFLYLHT
jgi:hypothetical protein